MKYNKHFQESFQIGYEVFLIRPVRVSDRDDFVKAFDKLSKESLKNRFLFVKKGLTEKEVDKFTNVDFETQVAFVLIKVKDGVLLPVGTTRFYLDEENPARAEFAITVLDEFQRQGMGSILFDYLLKAAKERNLSNLYGIASSENTAILNLLKKKGEVTTRSMSNGVIELNFILDKDIR